MARVTPLGRLIRIGVRKGVFEASRPWLITGGVAVGIRLLQRVARQGPDTVYSEDLAPGEAVVVRVLPPRKGRHRQRSGGA